MDLRNDAKPIRRKGEVGLDEPLEFQKRLFVKDDAIDRRGVDLRLFQAIGDRVRRKVGIVLLAREALFLRRRDDLAIADQGGGAIVVEGGNPQNQHRNRIRTACR